MGEGGSRKVTYSLPEELLGEMESAVRDGAAPSYSAFVAEAVRERLERLRERRLAESFAQAGEDPLFLEDVEETMEAFAAADGLLPRESEE